MAVIVLAFPAACSDFAPTPAEHRVIAAMCGAYEACAPEVGRAYATDADCWAAYREVVRVSVAKGAYRISEAEAEECAADVAASGCERFAAEQGRTGCWRVDRVWFRYAPRRLLKVGEACGPGGYDCEPEAVCASPAATSCPVCMRSAKIGEGCADAVCEMYSSCEGAVPACVSWEGKPCIRGCGPTFTCVDGHCRRDPLGVPGAPCRSAIGCWDGLACLDGRCEARRPVGAPCTAGVHCQTYECLEGRCVAPARRGEACASRDRCDGYLDCRDGVCADYPAEGETCTDFCQEPLECRGGRCRRPGEVEFGIGSDMFCGETACWPAIRPSAKHLLPLGETCGGPTRYGGFRVFACARGYCDIVGSSPTFTCQPTRRLNESCDGFNECPADGFCHKDTRKCARRASIGQRCYSTSPYREDESCAPGLYCTTDDRCARKQTLGAACSYAKECQSGECRNQRCEPKDEDRGPPPGSPSQ